MKKRILFFAGSAQDWGGASRCVYLIWKMIDLKQYEPLVLFNSEGPVTNDLDKWGIDYRIWGDRCEFSLVNSAGLSAVQSAAVLPIKPGRKKLKFAVNVRFYPLYCFNIIYSWEC